MYRKFRLRGLGFTLSGGPKRGPHPLNHTFRGAFALAPNDTDQSTSPGPHKAHSVIFSVDGVSGQRNGSSSAHNFVRFRRPPTKLSTTMLPMSSALHVALMPPVTWANCSTKFTSPR